MACRTDTSIAARLGSHSLCLFIVLAVLWPIGSSPVFAQGGIGVPFLLVRPSAEASGWGGVGTAVVSNDPLVALANPSQLGMATEDLFVAASSHTGHVNWLSLFPYGSVDYFAFGISAGTRVKDLFPDGLSVAAGYSRVSFSNANAVRTNSNGVEIGRFGTNETSDVFTAGLGTSILVRFAAGVSIKRIHSQQVYSGGFAGLDSVSAAATAFDVGLMLQIPVFTILKQLADKPVVIVPGLDPVGAITLGYTRSNIGGAISYVEGSGHQLPLEGALGLSIEVGASVKQDGRDWRILSFIWARESADILARSSYGMGIVTKSGIAGDVSFIDNLLFGRRGSSFELRKGWQIGVAECLIIRGGSCTLPGNLQDYGFSSGSWGVGLRLAGFMKLIESGTSLSSLSPPFKFVLNHVDLQFDHAVVTASGTHSIFDALRLVVR